MTDYKIPTAVEKAVVTLVYTEAEEAHWSHLQDADRTRLYQKWTDDPEIGGRLLGFVGQQANIRTWLKDCPMKEFERARRGDGKYAKYVNRPAAILEQMLRATLGPEWEVIPRTTQLKPKRARVRKIGMEDEERHFVTGNAAQLKHLTWPAILDQSNRGTWPWTICVVNPFRAPVSPETKEEHRRVAEFLGVQVVYFNEM